MNVEQFSNTYCVERKNTACLKWDSLQENFGDKDLLPMWVADMEFKAPDEVINALKERVEHGVFGYSFVTDDYYNSFFSWQKIHHGMDIKKEEVRFTTGIVIALYWLVSAYTNVDDSVIIMSPVYYPFYNSILDTGRKLVISELVNTNGVYSVDFEAFEDSIIKNDVKLFILCSPHNPVGRVWTSAELEKMLAICKKHNVIVISDEIHQDFTFFQNKFISSLNISNGDFKDILIIANSSSKTFNLAGLIHSHLIIPNKSIRDKYDKYSKIVNHTEPNLMGLVASEAAYNHGYEWLSNVLEVIAYNYNYIKDELKNNSINAIVTPLEGTYLMWIDFRPCIDKENLFDFIQNRCGLAVDYGDWFGVESKGFIRINLATHPKYIKIAIDKIVSNIKNI